jgi:hypothetical protein
MPKSHLLDINRPIPVQYLQLAVLAAQLMRPYLPPNMGPLVTGWSCGEPAISLHSHHVSLVQCTTRLLPVTRDPGSNPLGGYLCETGIFLLVLSRYIGDPDVINHAGLVPNCY